MTAPDPRPRHQSGARPLGTDDGGSGKKAAWLLPLILLLALLAAIAIFLIVRNAGDDNDKAGVDVTNDQGAAGTTTTDAAAATTTTAPGATTTTAAGSSETTAAGSATTAPSSSPSGDLSSGSQALVPPPASGLSGLVGDPASGTATVESVVADEGFWVGNGPGERVFVHLAPEARKASGESPFQVEAGQTITLEGTVTKAPADPATLGLTEAEGAGELTKAGGYIEATKVELSR